MPGVAEVATIGGMVRQYQVVVDPDKLRAFGIPLARAQVGHSGRVTRKPAVRSSRWAKRNTWYAPPAICRVLKTLADIPLGVNDEGTPLLLSDVADIRLGPQMRRGVAELDGEGEVVGAVVVMRWGENALATIDAVKERLRSCSEAFPRVWKSSRPMIGRH